jgi:hypothetical protein
MKHSVETTWYETNTKYDTHFINNFCVKLVLVYAHSFKRTPKMHFGISCEVVASDVRLEPKSVQLAQSKTRH